MYRADDRRGGGGGAGGLLEGWRKTRRGKANVVSAV